MLDGCSNVANFKGEMVEILVFDCGKCLFKFGFRIGTSYLVEGAHNPLTRRVQTIHFWCHVQTFILPSYNPCNLRVLGEEEYP